MEDVKGETAPALGISLNAQFAAGRQLVFQTHVPQEATREDIQALLLKLNDAIDIEEAHYMLPELEKSVEVSKNQMYTIDQQIGQIDAKLQGNVTERGRPRPDPKADADRANMVKSKARMEELLAKDVEKLEDTRKKASKRNGAASTADR